MLYTVNVAGKSIAYVFFCFLFLKNMMTGFCFVPTSLVFCSSCLLSKPGVVLFKSVLCHSCMLKPDYCFPDPNCFVAFCSENPYACSKKWKTCLTDIGPSHTSILDACSSKAGTQRLQYVRTSSSKIEECNPIKMFSC